ncbi:SdpI family protein [uncultured Mesonia sp.]|uniref:SdpI family protein n=1 Tax=uncultured Mesonia sp. TaxID=399731 RepID=UPI00374F485F
MIVLVDKHFLILLAGYGFISVFAGIMLRTYPPKKINSFYGYKSYRSQKGKIYWLKAQQFAAKYILQIGLISLFCAPLDLLEIFSPFWSAVFGLTFIAITIVWLFLKVEKGLKALE